MELEYDRLIDQLIEMRKEEVDKIWQQSAIVFVLRERMQVKAKDLAASIGVSSTYINDLARTFAAFPEEYVRNKEMSFTIHKICAKTNDPEYWLEEAEKNQYSSRQLQEAIKGKLVSNAMDKVVKLYEKVVKTLEDGGPEADWLSEQLSVLGLSQ